VFVYVYVSFSVLWAQLPELNDMMMILYSQWLIGQQDGHLVGKINAPAISMSPVFGQSFWGLKHKVQSTIRVTTRTSTSVDYRFTLIKQRDYVKTDSTDPRSGCLSLVICNPNLHKIYGDL